MNNQNLAYNHQYAESSPQNMPRGDDFVLVSSNAVDRLNYHLERLIKLGIQCSKTCLLGAVLCYTSLIGLEMQLREGYAKANQQIQIRQDLLNSLSHYKAWNTIDHRAKQLGYTKPQNMLFIHQADSPMYKIF